MSETTADTPARRVACRAAMPRLVTLKRRSEFLSVRAGGRWATPAFVLEGKRRSDGGLASSKPDSFRKTAGLPTEIPRFGFTVSKKVGGAVERNRIKRRLRAAVRDVLLEHARQDYDYVLVARRPALDTAFAALVSDLAEALKRVHARSERPQRGKAAGS
jgi:ribonuclease P protein component